MNTDRSSPVIERMFAMECKEIENVIFNTREIEKNPLEQAFNSKVQVL